MTNTEAKQVINSKRHIDAVIFYRKHPMETTDTTFGLVEVWLEAVQVLAAL